MDSRYSLSSRLGTTGVAFRLLPTAGALDRGCVVNEISCGFARCCSSCNSDCGVCGCEPQLVLVMRNATSFAIALFPERFALPRPMVTALRWFLDALWLILRLISTPVLRGTFESIFRSDIESFAVALVPVELVSGAIENAVGLILSELPGSAAAGSSPSALLLLRAAVVSIKTFLLVLVFVSPAPPPPLPPVSLALLPLLLANGSSYFRLDSRCSAAVTWRRAAASPLRRILPCTSADWVLLAVGSLLSLLWLLRSVGESLLSSFDLGRANALAIAHAALRWRSSSWAFANPPFEQYTHSMQVRVWCRADGLGPWLLSSRSGCSSPSIRTALSQQVAE